MCRESEWSAGLQESSGEADRDISAQEIFARAKLAGGDASPKDKKVKNNWFSGGSWIYNRSFPREPSRKSWLPVPEPKRGGWECRLQWAVEPGCCCGWRCWGLPFLWWPWRRRRLTVPPATTTRPRRSRAVRTPAWSAPPAIFAMRTSRTRPMFQSPHALNATSRWHGMKTWACMGRLAKKVTLLPTAGFATAARTRCYGHLRCSSGRQSRTRAECVMTRL